MESQSNIAQTLGPGIPISVNTEGMKTVMLEMGIVA